MRKQLSFLKTKIVQAVNLLPFNSTVIGTPRKCSAVATYLESHPEVSVQILTEEQNVVLSRPVLNNQRFADRYVTARTTPAQYILGLSHARVWGANGAVITKDDTLLHDVSREFGTKNCCRDHSVFHNLSLVSKKYIEGSIAVIATAGANVYYHWMLDVLPRLLFLKEANLFEKIDYFIINHKGLPFQKQTLKFLQVDENKIIVSDDNWRFHVEAGHLVVPALPSKLNEVNAYECSLLKKFFLENEDVAVATERLYISRRKAGTRTIIKEDDLIEYLERFNFKVIELEGLTVFQQAQLFNKARIIVGAHGSAFANIVFSQRDTVLVDILPDTNIVTCFHNIASQVGVKYYGFIGKGVPMNASNKNDNIEVDISSFARYMEANVLSPVSA